MGRCTSRYVVVEPQRELSLHTPMPKTITHQAHDRPLAFIIQGLRGIASLLVVFTHIARAFDEELFKPTSFFDEETRIASPPRIYQYPIIRILFQGRVGVTIFSLVTGYVCALKPIRQIRAGHPEDAFKSISRSAFRRVPRLILPTTLATTLIWFFCQFGAFEVGNRVDSWWVNYTSPNMTPFFGNAVRDLLYHLITTWTRSWNVYDNNQWTLLPLLKGSMLVYTMLVATAYCKSRYRMMIEFGLFVYYYISNDCKTLRMHHQSHDLLANMEQRPLGCNSSSVLSFPISLNTLLISPGAQPANGPGESSRRP